MIAAKPLHTWLQNPMAFKGLIFPCLLGCVGVVVLAFILYSLGMRKSTKNEAFDFGLYGITGRMGGGKSYFMTWLAYRALAEGREVYANFVMNDERAHLVCTWTQVCSVPDESLVLLDEVHLWWPSSAWKAPDFVMSWCSQIRHHKLTVYWASQHISFTASRLVRLTFAIWECQNNKFGGTHTCRLYDATTFASRGKRELIYRMHITRKPEVMALYDTHRDLQLVREWGDAVGPILASVREEVS